MEAQRVAPAEAPAGIVRFPATETVKAESYCEALCPNAPAALPSLAPGSSVRSPGKENGVGVAKATFALSV